MTPRLVNLPASFAPVWFAPNSTLYDLETAKPVERRTYTCLPRSCTPSTSAITLIALSLISFGYLMCLENDCNRSLDPMVRLPMTSGYIMLFIACVRVAQS